MFCNIFLPKTLHFMFHVHRKSFHPLLHILTFIVTRDIISSTWPVYWSAHPDSYADLCSLVTQIHPVRCGKVHSLWHTVTTAHFRDKGTGVADHKLAAPLDCTVNLDTFAAKHLWRDLENHKGEEGDQEVLHSYTCHLFFGYDAASEKLTLACNKYMTNIF